MKITSFNSYTDASLVFCLEPETTAEAAELVQFALNANAQSCRVADVSASDTIRLHLHLQTKCHPSGRVASYVQPAK